MNKVFLTGNLTKDPEIAQTSSGVNVCRFALAVSRDYANADGNRETDFFQINVWRNKGEACYKVLKKGKKVAIVGSLQTRSYEDKDGVKRQITEIIASDVEFLSPKEEVETTVIKKERPRLDELAQEEKQETYEQMHTCPTQKLTPVSDDDFPF